MSLITLRHSRNACLADLAFYALTLVGLSAGLLQQSAPLSLQPQTAAQVLGLYLLGLLLWSLLEYLTHRFVLHGLQPFQRWHALHLPCHKPMWACPPGSAPACLPRWCLRPCTCCWAAYGARW